MKKFFNISIATCTIFLLASCANNNENNNKLVQTENTQAQEPEKINSGDIMITTNSGLKYQILQESASAQLPQRGQQVTVHYTGWLDENGQQGKKFDSSVDRNEPFTFILGVGMVIRGWDEGVSTMKLGEKRRLIIPANLGYGTRGAGNVIPGNATLIFDVELLKIS